MFPALPIYRAWCECATVERRQFNCAKPDQTNVTMVKLSKDEGPSVTQRRFARISVFFITHTTL